MIVNNSGIDNNEIYNNNFTNIIYAALAQETNRSTNGVTGLEILCNEYVNNTYDIAVTTEGLPRYKGIKANQGSDVDRPNAPAGNRFSNLGIFSDSDYANECENIIYWHHLEADPAEHLIPDYHTPLPVVDPRPNSYNQYYNEELSCPSNLTGGGGSIEGEKSLMATYDLQADSVNNLMVTLEDGGDTEALNTEVQTSWPDEAYEVYSELMGSSPYLTDTVMVSSVEKENVLNSTMLTDILSANPQGAKSDSVQQSLDNRANQLSNNQRAQIDQGLYIIGAMEALKADLSNFKGLKSRSFNKILRYYKNDTTLPSARDSVISLLNSSDVLNAKYKLAFEYFNLGDTANVTTCLNNIPGQFTLSASQQADHDDYQDYLNVLLAIDSAGRSIYQADSAEIADLYTIVNNSKGKIKSLVRNVLMHIDTLSYTEPYIFLDNLKTSRVRYHTFEDVITEDLFNIYPNPASDYVVVEYSVSTMNSKKNLIFTDAKGITMKYIQLDDNHDYLVIPISDFPNGVFLGTLRVNGNNIKTIKFTKANN
ncbi:MAG: hypothetical protein U5Q03_12405 [Bacteroidota bacterium]|nr:hypothetical protein [Bacteroidota bacterium]